MSEYLFVEKPFLDHLHALGWEVIDRGAHAIPSDPAASLRDDFRAVTLRRVFCETVRGINLLPDGSPWLSDSQLASLHDELTVEVTGKPLRGRLNFHWRCMMAPLIALDYIVAHELAHLVVPNHSPAFWSELDKVMPDYRERRRWLRERGAGMDL